MTAEMAVHLIAGTWFRRGLAEKLTGWWNLADDGGALAEFAGRACYQSWNKPNPATATNEQYLAHIIEAGHLSVLEHASATFYITGVSRAFTHELIRHRHLSYSQLSQRFVDESTADWVVPPAYRGNSAAIGALDALANQARATYTRLLDVGAGELTRKQTREAARAVLPNMTETRIVVTGNYRAWREVIARRTDPAADAEMRQVAKAILAELIELAPTVFKDLA